MIYQLLLYPSGQQERFSHWEELDSKKKKPDLFQAFCWWQTNQPTSWPCSPSWWDELLGCRLVEKCHSILKTLHLSFRLHSKEACSKAICSHTSSSTSLEKKEKQLHFLNWYVLHQKWSLLFDGNLFIFLCSLILDCVPEEPEMPPPDDASAPQEDGTPEPDHTYSSSCSCSCHCHHNDKILNTRPPFTSPCLPPTKPWKFQGHRYVKDDRTTRLNIGLPSKVTFDRLFQMMEGAASKLRYWQWTKKAVISTKVKHHFKRSPKKSGPQRKLPLKSEFLLTLMKLRTGNTNEFMATTFGILPSTCSAILHTWVRFLADFFSPLVYWPDKASILATMPEYLRNKYPNLRCIIDCSETPVERPRDLKLQAATWSDYKKKNTLKYLVAITPTGQVSFISKAWGGRATDRYITQVSGFLSLIDPYDTVMADRGFPIQEDLSYRHAKLEIPPPSSGLEQMCAKNVMKTKHIANIRIHVERAINRLKWFNILNSTLQLNLLPLFNDILLICSALCNIHGPLMSWC